MWICAVKEIPLTQNQVALVDDTDFEWLSQWKWYAEWHPDIKGFYAARNFRLHDGGKRLIRMHRLILGLERGDKRQGDHKNHNTLDNQRENLRIVTNQENHFNQKNRSGYCWDKRIRKFRAQITIGGKQKHLGLFDTAEKAQQAYVDAKSVIHVIAG